MRLSVGLASFGITVGGSELPSRRTEPFWLWMPMVLFAMMTSSAPPLALSKKSPRFHTVKYAGVLAPASPWRTRIGPRPAKPQELAPSVAADAQLAAATRTDEHQPA